MSELEKETWKTSHWVTILFRPTQWLKNKMRKGDRIIALWKTVQFYGFFCRWRDSHVFPFGFICSCPKNAAYSLITAICIFCAKIRDQNWDNTWQNGSVSKIAVNTGKLIENDLAKIILSLLQINTPRYIIVSKVFGYGPYKTLTKNDKRA